MMTDYQKIEKAIGFINEHYQQQPNLEEIASQVHLSPFHFQRMFKEWAGVSPKKFLQYISLEHAKELLQKNHSLADVSFEAGLSGTSRLHDLFISVEGMTPGEYKNDAENLSINYSFAETVFGDVLIASTAKGVCHIAFIDEQQRGFEELHKQFSKAQFAQKTDLHQQNALQLFQKDWTDLKQIKLHLRGTAFQLKVWEALLKIPAGAISTYSGIASIVGVPNGSRAVGTAVANNPIAYLIPCHRVIRATGVVGEYHWGSNRKTAMIGWESAVVYGEGKQS